jgi:hypothetical protein
MSGVLISRTRLVSLALTAFASAIAVSARDWRKSAAMTAWVVQLDGAA